MTPFKKISNQMRGGVFKTTQAAMKTPMRQVSKSQVSRVGTETNRAKTMLGRAKNRVAKIQNRVQKRFSRYGMQRKLNRVKFGE